MTDSPSADSPAGARPPRLHSLKLPRLHPFTARSSPPAPIVSTSASASTSPSHSPPPTIHEGRRASMPALSNDHPARARFGLAGPDADGDSSSGSESETSTMRRRRRPRTPSPEYGAPGSRDSVRPRVGLSRAPSLSSLAGSVREWSSEQTEKLARFLGQDEPRALTTAKPSYRPNAGKTAMLDTLRASITNWSSLASVPSIASLLPTIGPHTHAHDGAHDDDDSDESEAGADEPPHSPTSAAPPDAIDRLTGNVVMIGGYRGSILRDAHSGKRLWFSLKIAFGVHKPDLSIGLAEEDELRTEETIVPGKMLTTLLGFLDSGRSLARRIKARQYATAAAHDGPAGGGPGEAHAGRAVELHSFGYDWRRNLDLSSAKLLDKLAALKAQSAEGATVFAHSMGGLVVLHALATAPDPTVFKAVVFAGVPLNGCINILGPLRLGDGDISSPAVAFSCRSCFYFLPYDRRCFERKDGARLDLDLHDPAVWSEYGLSPVMEGVLDPDGPAKVEKRERARKAMALSKARAWLGVGGLPVPGELGMDEPAHEHGRAAAPGAGAGLEAQASHPEPTAVDRTSDAAIVDYFNTTIARVHRFHADIADGFDEAKLAAGLYPPIALIAADNAPTVRGAITSSLEKVKRPHKNPFNKFLFADGDGVVCRSPPPAY